MYGFTVNQGHSFQSAWPCHSLLRIPGLDALGMPNTAGSSSAEGAPTAQPLQRDSFHLRAESPAPFHHLEWLLFFSQAVGLGTAPRLGLTWYSSSCHSPGDQRGQRKLPSASAPAPAQLRDTQAVPAFLPARAERLQCHGHRNSSCKHTPGNSFTVTAQAGSGAEI